MRVVVTGAGGLVGGQVIELLRERHHVWAISRSASHAARSGVQWVTADLAEARVPAGLPDRADAVIHLAQSPHYREFPARALDVFNVNVASTARLLDWSRSAGVRQFLLASSGGVGGATAQNFYLATRQSAELLASGYASLIDILIARFFFVYGPGQDSGMLVPRLIQSVASATPIALAQTDGAMLNPVHVSDAAAAVVAALEQRATGVIDIAGPETLTIRTMADAIAAALKRRPVFSVDSTRSADRLIGDVTRMSALHVPRIRFADGITGMLGEHAGGRQS